MVKRQYLVHHAQVDVTITTGGNDGMYQSQGVSDEEGKILKYNCSIIIMIRDEAISRCQT